MREDLTNQDDTQKTEKGRRRAFAPKSRSGCLTCRKRRIKCDEHKPSCQKCAKSGFSCDGYSLAAKVSTRSKLHDLVQKPTCTTNSVPIHNRVPIPTLQQWAKSGGNLLPQLSNNLFGTEKEAHYFQLFRDKVAVQLSGFYDSSLWNQLILQTAEKEESVRHGIISIGALQQTIDLRSQQNGRYVAPFTALDEHHRFAIEQYSKAIKQMRDAIATQKHNLRTTLLTCLLIICFESLHGNHESAITQMQIGIHLLEEFITSKKRAMLISVEAEKAAACKLINSAVQTTNGVPTIPSFAIESPAPGVIEDDLVQVFARLDMQSNSFIDCRPVQYHMEMKRYGTDCITGMPSVFSTVHEARKYFELVMRRLIHWINSVYGSRGSDTVKDAQTLNQLSPGNPWSPRNNWTPDAEEEEGGILNRHVPNLEEVSAATYWERQMHLNELEQWWHAFTPILYKHRQQKDSREYLCVTSLQLRFTATRFALSTTLNTDQLIYDERFEEIKQVIRLAKILHSQPSAQGQFAFDLGYIPQLYVMAIKCRDHSIRREAVQLLLSKSWREGVWDSILAGRMANAVIEIEEHGVKGGFIPNEKRVNGTKMKFDLQKREGHLTCFMVNGQVEKRTIRWLCPVVFWVASDLLYDALDFERLWEHGAALE